MEYSKPWLTFERQADLLINERGLIADRDCLIAHLADIGYYRLSGYWYNFRFNPLAENKFSLDSKAPDFTKHRDFLNGEVRYSSLALKNPERAQKLLNQNQDDAEQRRKYLEGLVNLYSAQN